MAFAHATGLIAKDRDQRRHVNDHRGNPRSSYCKSP